MPLSPALASADVSLTKNSASLQIHVIDAVLQSSPDCGAPYANDVLAGIGLADCDRCACCHDIQRGPRRQAVEVSGFDRQLRGLDSVSDAPRRAFTMNQAATEIMLALGLHDRMVGTAFLDDAILPEFAEAYDSIHVRTMAYPSREVLLGAQPDFVYAAYPSGISAQVGGMSDLLQSGTRSYLSPSGCREQASVDLESMELVFGEIRDVGRIFGVLPRAEQLIARYRAELAGVHNQLGTVTTPLMKCSGGIAECHRSLPGAVEPRT